MDGFRGTSKEHEDTHQRDFTEFPERKFNALVHEREERVRLEQLGKTSDTGDR